MPNDQIPRSADRVTARPHDANSSCSAFACFRCVGPFSEPAVDRSKQFACLLDLALVTPETLVKIDELLDGRGLSRDGRRIKWATMREATIDLENSPLARRLFGLVVQNEVRERLASVMGRRASK